MFSFVASWIFRVSRFTLPSLTLHLMEPSSQRRHAWLALSCLHAFSQLLFHISFVNWGEEGERQGKFVDTNTEPNAYHSERPAAKKGVFHQTRGGKLECPKHPSSWQHRQPSRADEKQTLRARLLGSQSWLCHEGGGQRWASFSHSVNFPNSFTRVRECPQLSSQSLIYMVCSKL